MILTANKPRETAHRVVKSSKKVSLSTYFPEGTTYFYGYPAGEDSGFLNQVPPAVEELVAARAATCAGPHVTVIGFAATNAPHVPKSLLQKLSIPQLDQEQLILLPQAIDTTMKGGERNQFIKNSLTESVDAKSLVMAQPFTTPDMEEIYQIPAKLTRWLNDKSTMNQYVTAQFMPAKLGLYENGEEFAAHYAELTIPFVAKASSSSAGDGVYVCLTQDDVQAAVKGLKQVGGTILAEQYIEARKNYGIHFGIPYHEAMPIDMLGVNEQLTTPAGEFIGGIISSTDCPAELIEAQRYLRDEILPKIRDMGWYGIGCLDVLTDRAGRFYFIDANFRMTGMSAYHCLIANGAITSPLMGFSGTFTGSRAAFEAIMLPLADRSGKHLIMQLIALSRHDQTWHFNAALFFDSHEQLVERAQHLLELKVESDALQQLTNN
jgi:hypothetical protein